MNPDAAPAIRGSTLCIATVCSGANVMPMPKPATMRPGSRCQRVLLGWDEAIRMPMPVENRLSPTNRIHLPPNRSDSRPANGAITIAISDIGAVVRPACSAESPSTDCRKMVSGRNRPNMPNAIDMTT